MNRFAACALLCLCPAVGAQTLEGVIDAHIHCDPDSMARSPRWAGLKNSLLSTLPLDIQGE